MGPTGVLLTHLHRDHTAGILDLAKDITYVVGSDESYINYSLLLRGDHLDCLADVHALAGSESQT